MEYVHIFRNEKWKLNYIQYMQFDVFVWYNQTWEGTAQPTKDKLPRTNEIEGMGNKRSYMIFKGQRLEYHKMSSMNQIWNNLPVSKFNNRSAIKHHYIKFEKKKNNSRTGNDLFYDVHEKCVSFVMNNKMNPC